jgi:hypothetical protein
MEGFAMSTKFRLLAAFFLLLAATPASAQGTPDAAAIIQAAKAASGGAAWDGLAGFAERGTHGGTSYRTWLSYTGLGMRMESGDGEAMRVHGFNGRIDWQARGGGAPRLSEDPAAIREAVTTAYLSNNGFFFPGRFPASLRWLREENLADRHFDAIEISPQGGRPFEMWFDRATHLPARLVDRSGTPPVIVDVSDYRPVGPVLAAFSVTVRTRDGTVVDEGRIESIENGPVDPALFEPPAPHR